MKIGDKRIIVTFRTHRKFHVPKKVFKYYIRGYLHKEPIKSFTWSDINNSFTKKCDLWGVRLPSLRFLKYMHRSTQICTIAYKNPIPHHHHP